MLLSGCWAVEVSTGLHTFMDGASGEPPARVFRTQMNLVKARSKFASAARGLRSGALRRRRASRRGGARAKAAGKLCLCRIDAARCAGPEKQGVASLRVIPARSASSRRFQRCAERHGFLLEIACVGALKANFSSGACGPRAPALRVPDPTWLALSVHRAQHRSGAQMRPPEARGGVGQRKLSRASAPTEATPVDMAGGG